MKLHMHLKKHLALSAAFTALFITSCQMDVPVREMVEARQSIEKAYTVKADKYNPSELAESEKFLKASHLFLKDEKDGDARESAISSLKASEKAIADSLPPYTADLQKKAEEKYLNAEKVYAEKFSPSEFTEAGQLLRESRDASAKKDYFSAIASAEKAYTLAAKAESVSLQNGPALETEFGKIEQDISRLQERKTVPAAEKNLTSAAKDVSEGKSLLASADFRKAYEKIESAKASMKEAWDIQNRAELTQEIAFLRKKAQKSLQNGGKDTIKEDLNRAVVALNSAEASIEQNNIEDASVKVKEARTLIDQADRKVRSEAILAKIEDAENKLQSAIKQDSENKYEESIQESKEILIESRKLLNTGEYDAAGTGVNRADTIITAVLNSLDDDRKALIVSTEKKDEKVKPAEKEQAEKTAEKVYTVRWRKKNTDCLWRISLRVYDDARLWPAIYLANRDQIKDPDLIFPGQKFRIPPKPSKRPDYKKEIKKKAVREEN